MNTNDNNANPASTGKLVLAFAAVYVIWGSTYLGLRYVVESMPPFIAGGLRFLTAGVLMYGWLMFGGEVKPTPQHWRDGAIAGTLLLLGGNGLISWAEQTSPSTIAALIVAIVPVWMVLLDLKRRKPTTQEIVGLALGVASVAWLVVEGKGYNQEPLQPLSVAAMLLATFLWALGSMFSRGARKPKSNLMTVAVQMVAGGSVMTAFGLIIGEGPRVNFANFTTTSLLAWTYLTLIGALIGYTAYNYMLQYSTPAKSSTYAFVNPLIAVLLGCTIGDEHFSPRLLACSFAIVGAVALIVLAPKKT